MRLGGIQETRKRTIYSADDPTPEAVQSLRRIVKKAAKDLDAEKILKYCCVIQLQRLETILEMEEKLNLLLPEGRKQLILLTKIAAQLAKYEIGELGACPARRAAPYGIQDSGGMGAAKPPADSKNDDPDKLNSQS